MLRAPVVRFANAPPGVGGREGVTIENMTAQFDPSVGWDDLADIRRRWPGTLVLKGAIGPDDARRAIAAGVDGFHLSNHGGRQLDRTLPPLELLPSVREAVGDEVTIIVDSGIRHGADVATAIALGADAGAIGRAYLYGLMAAGEPGVDRVAELFAAQFKRTMQLLGVRTVDELRCVGRDLLRDAQGEAELGRSRLD
jgi:L-lactate dehydrogenase (cytochrome)